MVAPVGLLLVLGLAVLVRRDEPTPLPTKEVALQDIQPVEPGSRLPSLSHQHVDQTDLSETVTNPPVVTNLFARLAESDIPRVSREQLEGYLNQNQRSAGALLGALRASGDNSLLAEAKEKFPHDPRVQFAAAFKTDSPAERQHWLEKFRDSDSGNALPDYLLAADHFKAGQTEQALQDINSASAKPAVENYLVDFIQNAEEAYIAAGFSVDEAKAIAATSALLPEQARLKQVGTELVELAKRYRQAGDEASAHAVLEMGLNLGLRLDQSAQPTLIQELVGIAIQKMVLNAMNPAGPYGDSGLTVQNQIEALNARRNAYKELTSKSEPLLRTMSDQELARYFDRVKLFGDPAAMRWVLSRAPVP